MQHIFTTISIAKFSHLAGCFEGKRKKHLSFLLGYHVLCSKLECTQFDLNSVLSTSCFFFLLPHSCCVFFHFRIPLESECFWSIFTFDMNTMGFFCVWNGILCACEIVNICGGKNMISSLSLETIYICFSFFIK